MTVEEGAVDGLQFCLTVTGYSNFIDRQYPVESFPIGSAKSKTTIVFVRGYKSAMPCFTCIVYVSSHTIAIYTPVFHNHCQLGDSTDLVTFTIIFADGTDYIFYDDVIIFDGFYFVGESECVVVNVTVPDDYLVEGNEVFNVVLDLSPAPCVFIIDNDCKVVHVSMLLVL